MKADVPSNISTGNAACTWYRISKVSSLALEASPRVVYPKSVGMRYVIIWETMGSTLLPVVTGNHLLYKLRYAGAHTFVLRRLSNQGNLTVFTSISSQNRHDLRSAYGVSICDTPEHE